MVLQGTGALTQGVVAWLRAVNAAGDQQTRITRPLSRALHAPELIG